MARLARQGGFSLAEVVVALGLLASVLISVAGMLVVGNRLVRSGRGSSEALALARDFMEEQNGWGFRQTLTLLECDVDQPLCVLDQEAAPLAPWKAMLVGDLRGGSTEVRVESLEPTVPLGSTQALRVTIEVGWVTDQRARSLAVGTVRM